jgi:hypothetical protein
MKNEKIIVDEYNINHLGTKYHRFYVVGCARPISKTTAKQGLKLGAKIIAVERAWMVQE